MADGPGGVPVVVQMIEEAAWTRVVLADARRAPRRTDHARQTVLRILGGSLAALLVLVVVGYVVGHASPSGRPWRARSASPAWSARPSSGRR